MRRPFDQRLTWDKENVDFMRKNAHKGYNFLAAHFNYSDGGIRSVAAKHRIDVASAKEVGIKVRSINKKPSAPRENALFVLQEILPNGSSKVWIPAEKAYITVAADKDVQQAVDKIVFRHAAVKFD